MRDENECSLAFCCLQSSNQVFSLLSWNYALKLVKFHVQNIDYTLRGVIPGDGYGWGIAYYLFPIAAAAAFGGAVWMLVRKVKIRKALCTQASEPQRE